MSSKQPIPTPSQLLERYFVVLAVDNWSLTTIARRRYSLGRLIKWLEQRDITSVADITTAILESYRPENLSNSAPKLLTSQP
jgi:site-specific recombinase XerD